MKYPNIVRAILTTPWAIIPEKLLAITEFVKIKAEGGNISDDEIQAIVGARPRPVPQRPGAIGVLPLFGIIMHRANMMTDFSGGVSTEKFTSDLRAMVDDPNVQSVVIDIDSPGGTVTGVDELSSEIFKAREKKRIIAIANGLAASAAYWIGSAATEFVAIPSAQVGSIGIFAAHDDLSKAMEMAGVKTTLIAAGKHKVEGNPYEPLTEEARESMQAQVDEFYEMFVRAVARNRGVSVSQVKNGFGQGRVVTAKHARAEEMIDRIDTMDQTLVRLGAVGSGRERIAAMRRRLALA